MHFNTSRFLQSIGQNVAQQYGNAQGNPQNVADFLRSYSLIKQQNMQIFDQPEEQNPNNFSGALPVIRSPMAGAGGGGQQQGPTGSNPTNEAGLQRVLKSIIAEEGGDLLRAAQNLQQKT